MASVVSFQYGKKVDGKRLRHFVVYGAVNRTKCGLVIPRGTVHWRFPWNVVVLTLKEEHIDKLKVHVTCKNCLRRCV